MIMIDGSDISQQGSRNQPKQVQLCHKLTAIAMHGNKIPYNVASCDVAIKQFNQLMLPMNGQIRIQVISVYMYSSQSTLYNASGI